MFTQPPPGTPQSFNASHMMQLMQQGQMAVQALAVLPPNHPNVGMNYNQAMAALQGLMQLAQMGMQAVNMPQQPMHTGQWAGFVPPQITPLQSNGWGDPPSMPAPAPPPPPPPAPPPVVHPRYAYQAPWDYPDSPNVDKRPRSGPSDVIDVAARVVDKRD